MISCLMVTQPGRLSECAASIASFSRQTLKARQLIIVHDGPDAFHQSLLTIARQYPDDDIRIHAEHHQSLGRLRNRTVELADHPVVCQWDDDDLNHPRRLEIQFEQMNQSQAEFCFFTDQLHWFEPQGLMFWDNWNVESYPGNLIQGTLMGLRDKMGEYPDLSRGEDTPMVFGLAKQSTRIATMRGFGWLNIYRYNGRNAWDMKHHLSISRLKHLRRDELEARLKLLQEKLGDYEQDWRRIRFPHESGSFDLDF